jgi:2-C-methyl-D-erythritol 2,4-cyclodiphosphate synthase
MAKCKMRIGQGYDVHRLVPERKLILGGVEVPYEFGLLGHSDADVIVHAIMDALLGAAGLWDIGHSFPDNDPAYKNISSMVLLEKVKEMLDEKGYCVVNVDGTIIAQRPKLSPYIPEMRANVARVLGLEEDCVNLKATTEEGMGFTGSGDGIAAQAVALLERL